MCMRCNTGMTYLDMVIKDNNQTINFCPNCLAIEIANNAIQLTNDPALVCDITNKHGAVELTSALTHEHYTLDADIMMRLIAYHLKPNEYKALIAKYSNTNYMLHDDYYDDTGHALQSIV